MGVKIDKKKVLLATEINTKEQNVEDEYNKPKGGRCQSKKMMMMRAEKK